MASSEFIITYMFALKFLPDDRLHKALEKGFVSRVSIQFSVSEIISLLGCFEVYLQMANSHFPT
jgi:hypothetical protein